jgi:hypothetical protein
MVDGYRAIVEPHAAFVTDLHARTAADALADLNDDHVILPP